MVFTIISVDSDITSICIIYVMLVLEEIFKVSICIGSLTFLLL